MTKKATVTLVDPSQLLKDLREEAQNLGMYTFIALLAGVLVLMFSSSAGEIPNGPFWFMVTGVICLIAGVALFALYLLKQGAINSISKEIVRAQLRGREPGNEAGAEDEDQYRLGDDGEIRRKAKRS